MSSRGKFCDRGPDIFWTVVICSIFRGREAVHRDQRRGVTEDVRRVRISLEQVVAFGRQHGRRPPVTPSLLLASCSALPAVRICGLQDVAIC